MLDWHPTKFSEVACFIGGGSLMSGPKPSKGKFYYFPIEAAGATCFFQLECFNNEDEWRI